MERVTLDDVRPCTNWWSITINFCGSVAIRKGDVPLLVETTANGEPLGFLAIAIRIRNRNCGVNGAADIDTSSLRFRHSGAHSASVVVA